MTPFQTGSLMLAGTGGGKVANNWGGWMTEGVLEATRTHTFKGRGRQLHDLT
jgi:hypothetical protein